MENPAPDNVLTARENGELVALLSLVQKGRLKPGGDQWQRYLDLFEAQQNGSRDALDARPDPEKPEDPFRLEAPAVPDRQEGAAEFYGVSVRTIKRWVDVGRDHSDPAPLRDPKELRAWAERMKAQKAAGFVHRCPAEIEAAAARLTVTKPVVVNEEQGQAPAAQPVRRYEITEAEKNTRSMIARLEEEEARLHRRFLDAIEEGADEAEVDQHRRRWTDASDILQRQRVRADKARDMITREEVRAAFERIIKPLPLAIVRAFPGDPPAAASWQDTVRDAVSKAFQRLPKTVDEMLAS